MSNQLTPFESWVIEEKGTESPNTGLYTHHDAKGFYHCKKCGAKLYSSEHKFQSQCGWPSFDDEIPGAVLRQPDADGRRVEIVCSACEGHLGHVFEGEGYTQKNLRHCVNSVSMTFKPAENLDVKTAIFASGCFWGTEYFMGRMPGVISTKVGYIGGHKDNPTYEEVCQGNTGHLEAVEVRYNPEKASYESLCKVFFETHDFSQENGQGPDIGSQYLSAVFTDDDAEKDTVKGLVDQLKSMGHPVATTLREMSRFYAAEDYHQGYYEAKGDTPYCHRYRKIFPD